jgi:hypothetical protein
MKTYFTLLSILALFESAQAQSITIDPASADEFTIRKTGIGLDIGSGSPRLGTAIIGGKAIIQAHSDDQLLFRTNNNEDNSLAIYHSFFSIGPPIFSPETFVVSKGRLKFTGSKDGINASGTEFTNASGTLLRGFVGMADNGNHLGFWGYGNNTFNVRLGATNGYMGIGAINPATRLHINGSMKILGLGHPLTELFVVANENGVLQTRTMNDIYTLSSADFVYRTGSTSLPVDTPYGLFYSSASSGTPVFLSPFNVPNGVILKFLNVGFIDNSSSNLETCLVKVDIGTTDQTPVLCATTTGSSASMATINLGFSPGTVIDNNSYQYFVRLRVLNGATLTAWPANDIKFVRANFSYSY